MGAELFAATISSEMGKYSGHNAPSELGPVYHQMRGDIKDYKMHKVKGKQFDRCTACSYKILKEYEDRGEDFVVDAIREPEMLERISGLEELNNGDFEADIMDF
jgi:ubiquitin-like modifier-activating enzyme ATG7